MPGWYTRPVVRVKDAPAALAFYAGKLGFKEDWRHEYDGRLHIVQVSRPGCELILSDQWPDEAGSGLHFVSVDPEDFEAMKLELAGRGVELKSGHWGYDLVIVEDPDGNRLWFPVPGD